MSRQFIATSAEVTPKGSLVRESYLFTAPTRGAAVRRKGILPKMALIHVRIYNKSPRYVYLFIYIFMVIYIYLYIYIYCTNHFLKQRLIQFWIFPKTIESWLRLCLSSALQPSFASLHRVVLGGVVLGWR